MTVDIRTGDTPAAEREHQRHAPPDILVTTPESLFLLLGSQFPENLCQVETVIIDEVHALAPAKRGTHLSLSLERLSAQCKNEPQRIGLSATVSPVTQPAQFLAGDREVQVVDERVRPRIDLSVVVPAPDMGNVPVAGGEGSVLDGPLTGKSHSQNLPPQSTERGIWSAIYPRALDEILGHRSTIVFANSRALCERLAQRLNELAEQDLVRAHHGSVSHQARREMEEELKAGQLRGIVATSSLELGIDMGQVDLVLQVESPGAVARALLITRRRPANAASCGPSAKRLSNCWQRCAATRVFPSSSKPIGKHSAMSSIWAHLNRCYARYRTGA